MRSYSDTIFALATFNSKSAIAVFRISGKNSINIINKISNKRIKREKLPTLCYLLGKDKKIIDQVVVTFYKSPHSYTGEDMIEISCHGSTAVITKIAQTLENYKLRNSEPGEFTKRALINNKINLIQAETINELVSAETENQRKVAISNLTGGLDIFIDNITNKLQRILADIEAFIDFSDEDLPKNLNNSLKEQIKNTSILMEKMLKKSNISKKIQNGFRVTIVGKPNTGKSSFINHINNKEISIVTNIPGTTTDLITSILDIQGNKYTFVDTAGIRKHKNLIEKIGIEKSIKSAKESDLNLIFLSNNEKNNYRNIKNKIFVKSKYDKNKSKIQGVYNISSITGHGVDSLLKLIAKKTNKITKNEPSFSRERQIKNLEKSIHFLKKTNLSDIDLAAENIRLSLLSLQNINQKFDIEKILDIIFSEFCIGK